MKERTATTRLSHGEEFRIPSPFSVFLLRYVSSYGDLRVNTAKCYGKGSLQAYCAAGSERRKPFDTGGGKVSGSNLDKPSVKPICSATIAHVRYL